MSLLFDKKTKTNPVLVHLYFLSAALSETKVIWFLLKTYIFQNALTNIEFYLKERFTYFLKELAPYSF